VIAGGASQPARAATPKAGKIEAAVHKLAAKLPVRSTLFGVWVKGRNPHYPNESCGEFCPDPLAPDDPQCGSGYRIWGSNYTRLY